MSVFTQLTRPRTERLLLVGAGHTHLYLLRHAARLQAQGYDITLVAPPVFSYSGNAVAVALGTLPSSAGRICVATLAQRVGVRHLAGTVREIDPSNGTAVTDIGESIHWDVLTLNIGSVSRRPDIELGGGSDDVLAAKPVGQLRRLAHLTAGADRPVVVVGAGSTGIEVAAQLSSRSSRPITLISASDKIGPGLPTAARDHLHNLLSERGVRILTRRRVRHLHDHCARLEDDTTVPYAAAVLATGLAAPPAVAQWGLGDRRGIPVLESLRHRDRSDIYAAGDCANFLAQSLMRLGVHGVRQGPVLLDALIARRAGRPEPAYNPGARHLTILDLGAGTALAARGEQWYEGPAALALKRRIDARWLARHT